MVALNEQFTPKNPEPGPKNRVGNFFGEKTKSRRVNRLSGQWPRRESGCGYDETASGMFFYGFRYYDPVTGRWPSRDPIGENGGINLYAMALNSPTSYIDINGQVAVAAVVLSTLGDCALKLAAQKLKSAMSEARIHNWLPRMCAGSKGVATSNHKNVRVPKMVFNPKNDIPDYRSAVFSCARSLVTKGVTTVFLKNKFPDMDVDIEDLSQELVSQLDNHVSRAIKTLKDGAQLEWEDARITTTKDPDNCCAMNWEIEGFVNLEVAGGGKSKVSVGILSSGQAATTRKSSRLAVACDLCK